MSDKELIKLPHDHGNNIEFVLSQMPEADEFSLAAESFRHISDPTRLRILWLLCHCEECVSNIAAAIGMTDPAVSHHLRILKQAGLITSRREGKEVHYRLADNENAHLLHQMIDDYFRLNCPNDCRGLF